MTPVSAAHCHRHAPSAFGAPHPWCRFLEGSNSRPSALFGGLPAGKGVDRLIPNRQRSSKVSQSKMPHVNSSEPGHTFQRTVALVLLAAPSICCAYRCPSLEWWCASTHGWWPYLPKS